MCCHPLVDRDRWSNIYRQQGYIKIPRIRQVNPCKLSRSMADIFSVYHPTRLSQIYLFVLSHHAAAPMKSQVSIETIGLPYSRLEAYFITMPVAIGYLARRHPPSIQTYTSHSTTDPRGLFVYSTHIRLYNDQRQNLLASRANYNKYQSIKQFVGSVRILSPRRTNHTLSSSSFPCRRTSQPIERQV